MICTDKTGTLTENRMHAEAAVLGGERHDLATPEGIGELGRQVPSVLRGRPAVPEPQGHREYRQVRVPG